MQAYTFHLIRDVNQDCFKGLAISTLSLHAFYVLSDYWAKIPSQKFYVGTCEGNQIGISVHGMMFIFRNPTVAERLFIDQKYGAQQWDKIGPAADEEGGLSMLEANYNSVGDDAKQDVFATHSQVEAATREFVAAHVWLDAPRRSMSQSDNASNYRDPTTERFWYLVGTRVFSEAGMGKDEGDANAAIIKGLVRRERDTRVGLVGTECATDIIDITRRIKVVRGQNYGIITLNRKNQTRPLPGRSPVPNISNYAMWTVTDEVITFWESLDVEASKRSIIETGRAKGFGPGLVIPLIVFDEKHSTRALESTGATLEMNDGESHSKQRPSMGEKRAAAKAQAEVGAERTRLAEAKHSAALAEAEAQYQGEVEQCPRCLKSFLTPGWFYRHMHSGTCIDRGARLASSIGRRQVPVILKVHDALSKMEERQRISGLPEVRVQLRGPGKVGITYAVVDSLSAIEVVGLISDGLALYSCKIGAGFLMAYNGEDDLMVQLAGLDRDLASTSETLDLVLRRPAPSLPFHGCARKGILKRKNYVLHKVQVAWLTTHVFSNGVPLMRDKTACEAMKASFSTTLRDDTLTPMWLDQDRIATWLCARVKEEKDRRKSAKKSCKATSSSSAVATQATIMVLSAAKKRDVPAQKKTAAAATGKRTRAKRIQAAASPSPGCDSSSSNASSSTENSSSSSSSSSDADSD